jgi:dihydrolipoamide dehydrogenase
MYDLGIIGAGPAGYVAAERAGQKELKVVLFDKSKLGGVCLNEGCIPTKTMLYSAKIYDNAKDSSKYGITIPEVSFDFGKIMERKNKVVNKLVAGIGAAMKKYKVDFVNAKAEITGRSKEGIEIAADGKTFVCKNILIATGSEAFVPPIKGLNRDEIYTNREILQIKELPKSLTIIGGGVIGMEFASFFSSMGTIVTVIEMMPEVLTGIEEELSVQLRNEFTKKGVTFHLSSKVIEIKGKEVFFEKEGRVNSVISESILVSVGRKANSEGLGLDKLGVEVERGAVKIDNQCRTNIQNVYAAGDIKGFSLLAHTASREGEVVINNLTGRKDFMRYNAIPGIVYTNPEISTVGITEQEAKKKGIPYKTRTLPMAYAGRFIAENEGKSGIFKVIVGEKYEELLGVHIIGNPSSEMIYGAAMAIEMQMRVKDMEEIIFPHPTVSEIFKETMFAFHE